MKIEVHGAQTTYQKIGNTGPILILLHGWGGDWQVWYPVISQLSRDFQLIIPDLPGLGSSTIGDNQVWDSHQYASWLAEFIQKIAARQRHLVAGHSFGGKIAAIYAAQQPQNLKGIVLIDSAGLPTQLTQQESASQKISHLLPSGLKKIIPSSLKNALLSKLGIGLDYQAATQHQQDILKKIVRENISPELKKIKTPTLVIWGENDQTTPLEKGREFAQIIPTANLEIIKKAGHYPFLDQPHRFLLLINNFLKEHIS